MNENKQGRWKFLVGSYYNGKVYFECSECGATAVWKKGMKSMYPADICPNCHADMKGRLLPSGTSLNVF